MKKVLLIATALFFAMPNMQAQDKDKEVKIVLVKEENSDNYYYEGVVPVDSISKEEMFKRAKGWILSNLKTGDNNIQFDEQDLSIINNATILIKRFNKGILTYDGATVNFKVKLQFKDNKYKFRFDNVIVRSDMAIVGGAPQVPYGEKMYGKKYSQGLKEKINKALIGISSELENAIKGIGAKKDDW